jgi:hypothetical protein
MLPHAVLPTQSQQARESSSGVSGPMRKWSRSSYSHGERTDPACRFLPVRVEGRIDVEWLRANARQVIGEAAAREAAGEAFSIPAKCCQRREPNRKPRGRSRPLRYCCRVGSLTSQTMFLLNRSTCCILHAFALANKRTAMPAIGAAMRRVGFCPKVGKIPLIGAVRGWIRSSGESASACARLVPFQAIQSAPVESG